MIHFLQTKFTATGLYLDPNDVVPHLEKWKGKSGKELESDNELPRCGVLESAVRDRLAEEDKYEVVEESELERVTVFFQSKYLKKGSVVAFRFPAEGGKLEIWFSNSTHSRFQISGRGGKRGGRR
ncbi:Probable chalcone--flavanone isomerase 3 [Linum perenne]